jgi:hypothetical protein
MCTCETSVVICSHVAKGTKPTVLIGGPAIGLEYAICSVCNSEMDALANAGHGPEAAAHLLEPVCRCCAERLGLPVDLTTVIDNAQQPC